MTTQAHDTITPGAAARSARRADAGVIQLTLLTSTQYSLVIHLTAPAARPVVTRAAASLPLGEQPRIAVREVPAIAFLPEPLR